MKQPDYLTYLANSGASNKPYERSFSNFSFLYEEDFSQSTFL